MRLNRKVLIALTVLSTSFPVLAAHTYTVTWIVSQATSIGNSAIRQGSYEIRVEEGQTELEVLSNGKVVAEVPCHWIQLPSKASTSRVEVDSDKVTEVKFSGKTAALDFK
jgi:hypothetical protein